MSGCLTCYSLQKRTVNVNDEDSVMPITASESGKKQVSTHSGDDDDDDDVRIERRC